MKINLLWIVVCLFITGCTRVTPQPTEVEVPEGQTTQESNSNMVNPASAFCEQKGYKLEIRTAADGNQSGVCIFPDGSECEEWAFFRGECKPVETPEVISDGDQEDWLTYTNEILGYSFQYPADAQIVVSDEPKKGLEISGPGMEAEFWGIAHPSDREEYRPPEGTDLYQWLSDHYMLGEERLADEQIAGTTAIHFRHARSPQSYAFDTYYFAMAGQLYQLSIGHSSENEDWELDNRFLRSFQFIEPILPSQPTPIPTALPIDPAAYQGWITYTHPVYNFTLRLPDNWIVEEITGGGPGMDGHQLSLHPVDAFQKESIRMTFREAGEETLLWPTGVGEGDFVPDGSLDIAREPAIRRLLVCPSGEVTAIWYNQSQDQPDLTRGNLELGFIYSATSTHCEAGYTLNGETQLTGESIISSLRVP